MVDLMHDLDACIDESLPGSAQLVHIGNLQAEVVQANRLAARFDQQQVWQALGAAEDRVPPLCNVNGDLQAGRHVHGKAVIDI